MKENLKTEDNRLGLTMKSKQIMCSIENYKKQQQNCKNDSRINVNIRTNISHASPSRCMRIHSQQKINPN